LVEKLPEWKKATCRDWRKLLGLETSNQWNAPGKRAWPTSSKIKENRPQLFMEKTNSTERHTLEYSEVERELGIMVAQVRTSGNELSSQG